MLYKKTSVPQKDSTEFSVIRKSRIMVEPISLNVRFLAREAGFPEEQVAKVVALLDGGATIPFIAKYRRDETGNLDEEKIRSIDTLLKAARRLAERKLSILKNLESSGKLTPEIDVKIRDAKTLRRLEDLYFPFKPRKVSLANTAKERGLEPLALEILSGELATENLDKRAADFINVDKKIKTAADALLGAGHIISETFAEKIDVLQKTRDFIFRSGQLVTERTAPPDLPAAETPTVETPKAAEKQTEEIKPETVEAKTTETEETASEPVAETATDDSVSESPVDNTVPEDTAVENTVPENTVDENTAVENTPTDVAAEVSEQFRQIKEAIEEKGLPTVQSQNTLRKKKKAEIKKKKDEAKAIQRERFEKRFSGLFNYSAGLRSVPYHRVLDIDKAEKAKVIRSKIKFETEELAATLQPVCVPDNHPLSDFLNGCLKDSLDRIVIPMLSRETRAELTESAEKHSFKAIEKNLRDLLLQPKLKGKRVLGIDAGIKHGCRLAALDEFGNVIGSDSVFIVSNAESQEKAGKRIAELIRNAKIDCIVLGNGIGCREVERCVAKMLASQFADTNLQYAIVNEVQARACAFGSFSKEEFPNADNSYRKAVSLGRQLQDALAELVKSEPVALATGAQFHDNKDKQLQANLVGVIQSCVNRVGVNINMATTQLLQYVAGLNQILARRITDYRRANGHFRSLEDLKKVTGINDTVFNQAAGFLRITGGPNPLDATGIHPESYPLAEKILDKLGFTIEDLRTAERVREINSKIHDAKITVLTGQLSEELNAGVNVTRDILDNISRFGYDVRDYQPKVNFRKDVIRFENLKPGMELMGTVSGVVNFGVFVDVGLRESGLVHISRMCNHFIRDANDFISAGTNVKVWVTEVDAEKKRFTLTMLPPGTERRQDKRQEHGEQSEQDGRPPREPREQRERQYDRQDDIPSDRRDDRPKRETRDNRGFRRTENKSEGEQQDRTEHRDDRRGGRDRKSFDRPAKTYIAPPQEKKLKPISEDMKKGKEPMRSFGDLAQFLGRVTVDENADKKKPKKEEKKDS
ncbi:MAG: helix-hairpin-helix domain-containing protein [Planctomycetaceae bacterium]|nr:helix-hairpin-helix domain-containing protein [Planctomycetaceae bacterium]